MKRALGAVMAATLCGSVTLAAAGQARPAKAPRAGQARAAAKPPEPVAAPECPRAAYKGDPVCFGEDGRNLPTPSARAVFREPSDDIRVNDAVSLSGADPKAMSRRPVPLNLPNPRPRKPEVSGGATMNVRF